MLHQFLAACRYLLVVPVIGCVLMTLGAVLMGFVRIVTWPLAAASDVAKIPYWLGQEILRLGIDRALFRDWIVDRRHLRG